MKFEPLRSVLLPIALGAFAAAAQAFIEGADTRGVVTAVLGALVIAGQEYARSKVVPEAKLEPIALRERMEAVSERLQESRPTADA